MQNNERITLENNDPGSWRCLCENTTHQQGFYPCNEKGDEIEPTGQAGWTTLYGCDRCGRIIDQHTLAIVGYRTNNQKPVHQLATITQLGLSPKIRDRFNMAFHNPWLIASSKFDVVPAKLVRIQNETQLEFCEHEEAEFWVVALLQGPDGCIVIADCQDEETAHQFKDFLERLIEFATTS